MWASLMTQLVKNPPAMRETWVQSLGWEDLLEKGKATHSSILAWRISCTVIVHEVTKSQTLLSDFHFRGEAPQNDSQRGKYLGFLNFQKPAPWFLLT